MRLLVHDFSGHPFQVELSRELSARGHDVTHSFCAAYTSGKGHLEAEPGETIVFDPIGTSTTIAKTDFVRRLFTELRFGVELIAQVRRRRPEVVVFSNTPIPSLVLVVAYLAVRRIPWVLWHQDVQAVAITSFAGQQLHPIFRLVGRVIGWAERWCARRAAGVVVIAESFLEVHRSWGTAEKTVVIPNWAPLEEIVPVPRRNAWSAEHGLDDVPTILYSGTLGLKHNPELLVSLTRQVRERGVPARLVVVNQGPAVEILQAAAEQAEVPMTLLPFQPYERLSEVLGSGDVLVVLLEQSAGAFSVPSKTLSYLCAGRPILGLMPAENLAAQLVADVDGKVLPPDEASLAEAAAWTVEVIQDPAQAQLIGEQSRKLAEREFALAGCADRFELILSEAHA